MKIENRGDTVFVSHNGLTIFFNKRKNNTTGEPFIAVNVHFNEGMQEDKKWRKIADMILSTNNLTELNSQLTNLNR